MPSKENDKNNRGILILTPFFSPNIGGVETHLDDLTRGLGKRGYKVYVQTYSPITTPGIYWKSRERKNEHICIRRYRWFGKNLFHKLEKYPFFDFLYLTPWLFLRTFCWLLKNREKIDVIHAQGLNAAWMGTVYKKIFRKKLVVSVHAVYEIDEKSSLAKRIAKILGKADKILALSNAAQEELLALGVKKEKLSVFRYWIDLEKFRPGNKAELRGKLDLENKFSVLFVGRLIEKKGVRILVLAAEALPEANFIFAGTGPEEKFLKAAQKKFQNIDFLGSVANRDLPQYYAAADALCIPSQYEEGFGRVAMEAVACGTPVIASDKGGLREALDERVSVFVEPTPENIKEAIGKLQSDEELHRRLQSNCRAYAERNFSENNIEDILKYY